MTKMLSQSGVSHLVSRINDGTLPSGKAVCDEEGVNIHEGMTSLSESIGDMSKLTTTEKKTLVGAINEAISDLAGIRTGAAAGVTALAACAALIWD